MDYLDWVILLFGFGLGMVWMVVDGWEWLGWLGIGIDGER